MVNGGPWAKNRTCKVFGEKTVVSLMLSSHQCNQRLERKQETDGGHGSGDPSVSNQRCCSSSSGVYTRDVSRKRGRKRHINYAGMHVALRWTFAKVDSGSLLQPDVSAAGSWCFSRLFRNPSHFSAAFHSEAVRTWERLLPVSCHLSELCALSFWIDFCSPLFICSARSLAPFAEACPSLCLLPFSCVFLET